MHLEFAPNKKSPAFIRAFEMCESQNKTPKLIINDNFKTFKHTYVKEIPIEFGNSKIHFTILLTTREKMRLPPNTFNCIEKEIAHEM